MLLAFVLTVSTVMGANIKLNINNPYVTTAVAPIQENGTTLVPLRVVSENLGASVGWDGPTQTITINKGNTVIKLVSGSKNVTVNGVVKQLSVAPKSISGTTMVPIRFVSENLSSTIAWKNGTVFVTSTNNQTSHAYY